MEILRSACLRSPSHLARKPIPDLRLPRTAHRKPTAGGLTTATVVGPADEEISPANTAASRSSSSGREHNDYYRAWLSGKDNSGDATVPSHSGLAPRPHVPFFARMNGFDHQGSYQKSGVQAVTLYSILSLAVEAPKPA